MYTSALINVNINPRFRLLMMPWLNHHESALCPKQIQLLVLKDVRSFSVDQYALLCVPDVCDTLCLCFILFVSFSCCFFKSPFLYLVTFTVMKQQ